jgi:hypothetical protein
MIMLCLKEARQRPLGNVYAIALPPILPEEKDERSLLKQEGSNFAEIEKGNPKSPIEA